MLSLSFAMSKSTFSVVLQLLNEATVFHFKLSVGCVDSIDFLLEP